MFLRMILFVSTSGAVTTAGYPPNVRNSVRSGVNSRWKMSAVSVMGKVPLRRNSLIWVRARDHKIASYALSFSRFYVVKSVSIYC